MQVALMNWTSCSSWEKPCSMNICSYLTHSRLQKKNRS